MPELSANQEPHAKQNTRSTNHRLGTHTWSALRFLTACVDQFRHFKIPLEDLTRKKKKEAQKKKNKQMEQKKQKKS